MLDILIERVLVVPSLAFVLTLTRLAKAGVMGAYLFVAEIFIQI